MAFKFVDISDLTEGELIEIIEDNTKTAAFTREEIRKLKAAAKPKMTTPTIIVDNSKKEEQPVVDRSDFEDEVEYYYSQVREIKPDNILEKLHLCVPKRTNKNYEKIILRLKLESLRNIREINEIIREYGSIEDPEDMKMFKDEIIFEQQKIAYYDQLLSPIKEEVEETVEDWMSLIPLIATHICFALINTATSSVFNIIFKTSDISSPSFSCSCNLLAHI
jgi:hypothetical protein